MTLQTHSSDRSKRNPMLPWAIVAAVIAVMALAMFFKRGSSEPTPAAKIDEMASVGATPAQQRRPVGSSPSTGLPLSAESVQEQRQVSAEKRKQVQQQVDRTRASFTSRYNSEPTDAAWAGAKEAELERLSVSPQIEQMQIEARNLAIDCKSTMCRITADFPTSSAADDWVSLYMNNLGDKVPAAAYKSTQNPDGTVSINVYAMGRK